MATCEHIEFMASVDVVRLADHEGGPITGYSAEIEVRCAVCEEAFEFIGVPIGWLPSEPAVSVDGREARMPIRPESAPRGFGEHLTGFTVRIGEGPADD